MTSIEWTDKTWNPVVGCSLVSAGCENCYAMGVAGRRMSAAHKGLTVLRAHGKGQRWTGEVRYLPERLATPLGWRKPRRVFVNSMSDLFHEAVPDDVIAAVFGVMAATPQHTYQVLTKRPERARAWFRWYEGESDASPYAAVCAAREEFLHAGHLHARDALAAHSDAWPLPNVWIGVSVEDQETADERIPVLLDLPAAIRWGSYEPALGPVDFNLWLDALDWIVVGGESGVRARPFDVAWARSTIAQCLDAGVPVFVKQLGRKPHDGTRLSIVDRHGPVPPSLPPERAKELVSEYPGARLEPAALRLRDRKGGKIGEWPEDLRVRQWPEVMR